MRVLVVEDDQALGEFLKKGMEREGHVVVWVGDGEQALVQARPTARTSSCWISASPSSTAWRFWSACVHGDTETSVLVLTGRNGSTRVYVAWIWVRTIAC